MVIPNFVNQALRGLPITVFGDGSQTRCFGHVMDVVPAVVELLNRPAAYGKVFNIGNNSEISIRELAETVVKKTGSKSELRFIPYSQAYPPGFEDMQRRVPDLSKIGAIIGYRPTRGLDVILEDVIRDQQAKLEAARRNGESEAI
jgi:UDP-glucose 4-epimerase